MGMCKIIIIGNLGRDPEMRYTQSGLAVCNFSVAATEKIKGEDHTEWFKVAVFGKYGETLNQYLTKGKQVYVEGRLRSTEWTDQQGAVRHGLEVMADTVQMLGSKSDDQPRQSSNPEQQPQPTNYPPPQQNQQGGYAPSAQQQPANQNYPLPDGQQNGQGQATAIFCFSG